VKPRDTQPRSAGLAPTIEREPIREGQTFAGTHAVVRFANLVKLPHTIFALPFALLGVVYASQQTPVTLSKIILIVVAFTAARFAAMGFNRIVDRHWDAANPRTSNRELPRGSITLGQARLAVALAGVVFIAAASWLNRLCMVLSPVALLWILSYSYSKRFTSWSHVWLGASLAIAPVGGYLAVTGTWSTPSWTLVVVAIAVLTWVAGFDVFYALQDEAFDRAAGLRSAVIRLGRHRSILVAKLLHGVTVLGLVTFGVGVGFGFSYYLGVLLAVGLLAWEHSLVRPDDLSRLDAAFFTMNGIMSVVVFLGALGDRLI